MISTLRLLWSRRCRNTLKAILRVLHHIDRRRGIFYLLQEGEEIVGMGAIRKLKKDVGEIKRMYIRPEFRGKGFGKALLQQLLAKGKEFRFSAVYLDTALSMKTAQHICRSAGFIGSEQYAETEIPQSVRHLWLYMEKRLQ